MMKWNKDDMNKENKRGKCSRYTCGQKVQNKGSVGKWNMVEMCVLWGHKSSHKHTLFYTSYCKIKS